MDREFPKPPSSDLTSVEINDIRQLRRQAWQNESETRYVLETRMSEMELPPLRVQKSQLNIDNKRPFINYRADDVVEIQPRDEDGEIKWWVRNATLGEETPRPILPGELVELKPEEFDQFREYWRIKESQSLYRVESYLHSDVGDNQKVLVFKEADGEISGWTFVSESGFGGVHVSWIQTMLAKESRGVGGAIIEALKAKYSGISLNASSKHPTLSYEVAQKRLKNFYKGHGLVGGERWSKRGHISLDDKYVAGEWQKVELSVGVDSLQLSDADIPRIFFKRYAEEEDLRETLPNDLVAKLDLWNAWYERLKILDKAAGEGREEI